MFFDWQEIVVIWFAFGGIWSVALVVLIMSCVQLSVNKLKTPSDPIQRRGYLDARNNINLGKTNLRRFAESTRMLVINFVISVSFVIIVYKIFS